MPDPYLTLILPAFNEAEALPSVLADIANNLAVPHQLIVVDDASTDDTASIAAEAGATVIRHPTNRGKGAAMTTGTLAANTDRLVFMDADGSYPVESIQPLAELLEAHDVARGVRTVDPTNTPWLNRIGNRLFDRILSQFHQLEGTDHMSGLYAIRRDVFQRMAIESDGFDVEVEIGIKSRLQGLRVATTPIDYHPRIGTKKLRPVLDGLVILTRVVGMLVLFNPLVTFVIPGFIIAISAAVMAIALWNGPVSIASMGLSIHSFIVAALGSIAGLQMLVFGVAAALYRADTGYPMSRWLLRLARRPSRLGAAVVGGVVGLLGLGGVLLLTLEWIADGAGDFTATARLVGFATLGLVGLQLLSAGLFLSILASRRQ